MCDDLSNSVQDMWDSQFRSLLYKNTMPRSRGSALGAGFPPAAAPKCRTWLAPEYSKVYLGIDGGVFAT